MTSRASASGRERRARPVWMHLAVFALSIVVPLWCLLGVVAWTTVQQARRESQQKTMLLARNLASELDRELAGLGGMLQALATSPALQDADLQRFHAQIAQIVPSESAIVLRDRAGQHLVSTLFPYGTALPVSTAPEVLAADACVFRTAGLCVSDLYLGTTDRQPYVLLDAPVLQGGEVGWALSVAVRAKQIARILENHRLPSEWAVSILDRNDRIVARAPEHDRFVGSPANAALREHGEGEEGTVQSLNVAGIPVWGAYVRLPRWGWRVAIGVPEAALDAPLWHSMLVLGATGLMAVGASLAAALLYGRRLAAPVRALGRAAAEVGIAHAPGSTGVLELDRVADSLAAGEERLRVAQEAGRMGMWELDPRTGRAVISASQARLYGLPAEAAPHRFGWDAWLARIHPEDRARAEQVARAAVASGGGYEDDFRILRADTGEVRWVRARGRWSAGRREEGGGRFVGINFDITEAKEAESALAASEAEFRAIFENSVIGKAQTDPQQLRFVRLNRCLCDILGYPPGELVGRRTFPEVMYAEDRATGELAFREALAAARPVRAELRLVRQDGSLRWVIMSVALLPAAPGRPARTIVAVQDITERREAEERQALLAREVDHRAKNALAVVQAALRLTPRDDPAAFARAVEGRVGALARTQTLLAEERWGGAQLRALAEGELAGFVGAGHGDEQPRAHLAGPSLMIRAEAAQPLAMALHELATNATKYGSLSAPGGMVSITWAEDAAGGMLLLDWIESGGPPVPGPPERQGFGSRVLEATLHQLGGSVMMSWRAGGLACRLCVPLRRVAAHRQVAPPLPSMADPA